MRFHAISIEKIRAISSVAAGPTPVSYTHLDVYKRQFLLCIVGRSPLLVVYRRNFIRVDRPKIFGLGMQDIGILFRQDRVVVLEHDNTVIFLHTAEQFGKADQRPLTFTSISLMENILVIENYLHRVMLHCLDVYKRQLLWF